MERLVVVRYLPCSSFAAAGEVWVPKMVPRHDGTVETAAGLVFKQRPGHAGSVFEL